MGLSFVVGHCRASQRHRKAGFEPALVLLGATSHNRLGEVILTYIPDGNNEYHEVAIFTGEVVSIILQKFPTIRTLILATKHYAFSFPPPFTPVHPQCQY